MLNRSLECQATANISNTTILSIIYILQQAGESLQEIQVSSVEVTYVDQIIIIQYDNHQIYCPNYDLDEKMLTCANQTHTMPSVFRTLHAKNVDQWSKTVDYGTFFNSSEDIQYQSGTEKLCQPYMSSYTTLIMTIYQTINNYRIVFL